MSTPNMNLALPVEGGSPNVWDTILDDCLETIDGHTHLPGSGVSIVSNALNINNNVPWNGFSITGLEATAFAAQTASSVAALANAMFVNSADNNLYFRNSSGVNVQVTSGSTLNVSIVGGIGGDYASVGALLSYNDSTRRYLLQEEMGSITRGWAGIGVGNIDLYQKVDSGSSVISNSVKLVSPSALASAYTITFPSAVPVTSDSILQMNGSGSLSVSNTLAATAGLSMSGVLRLTGGTAYVSRARPISRFASLSPLMAIVTAGSVGNIGSGPASPGPGLTLAASTTAYIPLAFGQMAEEFFSQITIHCPTITSGATTVSYNLYMPASPGIGFGTAVASGTLTANASTNITFAGGLSASGPVFLEIITTSNNFAIDTALATTTIP